MKCVLTQTGKQTLLGLGTKKRREYFFLTRLDRRRPSFSLSSPTLFIFLHLPPFSSSFPGCGESAILRCGFRQSKNKNIHYLPCIWHYCRKKSLALFIQTFVESHSTFERRRSNLGSWLISPSPPHLPLPFSSFWIFTFLFFPHIFFPMLHSLHRRNSAFHSNMLFFESRIFNVSLFERSHWVESFFWKSPFSHCKFSRPNAHFKMHKLSYSGNEACSRSKKPFSSPGRSKQRRKNLSPSLDWFSISG